MTSQLMNVRLDRGRLLNIHLYSRYRTQYKPALFPGLIITLRKSKRKPHPDAIGTNMKLTIFESGTLVLCGAANPERGVQAALRAIDDIARLPKTETAPDPVTVDNWEFQNIVGKFALQQMYALSAMTKHCRYRIGEQYRVEYEPELNPAIQCRRLEATASGGNVVIQLHHTGQALISGCRTIDEFFDEIENFVSKVAIHFPKTKCLCGECDKNFLH